MTALAKGLRLLGLLALCLSSAARAWPVEVYADLEAGSERFYKLTALEWAQVEDPKVATAERMETGELLLSGVTPGRTLLLLYAEGRFGVWRVRVAAKGGKAPVVMQELAASPVAKACPKAKVGREDDAPQLSVHVADDGCRRALLGFLAQDGFSARQLQLTFEIPVLQAQLAASAQALPAPLREKVRLRYLGAGLVLEGSLSEEEHRQVLWTLFRQAVGRVALEDRTRE